MFGKYKMRLQTDMSIVWSTPAGTLFTCTAGTSVNTALTATSATNYDIISGVLPEGLSLSTVGVISGTVSYVEKDTISTFVVRASNNNDLKDRTFEITVPHDTTATWSTTGFSLYGSTLKKLLINKDHIDINLDANVDTEVTYSVDTSQGKLPFGLKLDPSGKLYGSPRYIIPPGEARDFPVVIIASDGVNEYSQHFIFYVINSFNIESGTSTFSLSSGTINIVDMGSTGTVALSTLQPPEFIKTGSLGTALADDRQYIPVKAYDPNPGIGPLVYASSGTLPAGLSLDPVLGYLYGNLNTQADYSHLYTFSITATKTDIETGDTAKNTGTFSLTVVNQYYNNVIWPNSNLGTITEGIISELSVGATQKDSTWELNYYLMPDSQLPAGIELSSSTGHLIGSASTSGSFTFGIAASTQTYIANNLTLPILPYPVAFNTFNLQVKPVSSDYTTIWAKPFLTLSQRQYWETFINDADIFLPDILYRADDPSFGLQTEPRVFLEFGIEKVNLSDYASALYNNFYERRLTLGKVKSAIAKDSKGVHVYDAIYVDIVDDLEGAKTSIVIHGQTYYPGSIDNIRNSLESVVLGDSTEIKVDGKHLPKFMTTSATGQAYGYIKAMVLCYTLPGQSNKILNRIRASKFNFNKLQFFLDRLVVQNSIGQTGTSYIVFNKQPVG